MRKVTSAIWVGVGLVVVPLVMAQPPGAGRRGDAGAPATDNLVDRMMAFDADKDGKLSKAEVTDERLHRLFDQADADKDGTVTKSELNVLLVNERAKTRARGPGFGGPGGPGGGGRGFGGPGGMRGFGGPGGPPQPGQILPAMLRQRLALTREQERQVDELQKDVDAKLAKILNAEQKQQLKAMRERGPGGFGGPPPGRGPGGFGPPPGGGPPPGDGPPPD
jgi:EF hand